MNQSDGENPYQAPSLDAAGVPDAPVSRGWKTDGRKVIVARSALLPMVDPYTGGTGETMMLRRISTAYLPYWLWMFPVVGAFLGLMADLFDSVGRGPYALPGALGGWLLARLVRLPLPVVQIELFLEKSTCRRRLLVGRTLLSLLLAGIAIALLGQWLPENFRRLPFPLISLYLLGNLAAIAMHRRIRCRRMDGDRYVLGGFHPLALKALVAEQERAVRRPPVE